MVSCGPAVGDLKPVIRIPVTKTPRSLLLALLACMLACASTRKFKQPLTQKERDELRELLPDSADVTWSDGDNVGREPALKLSVPGPTATWTHADTLQRREVPEAALRSIKWNSHSLGASRGFLIGGLAAGAALAILGAASGSDSPCPPRGTPEVFYCISASAGEKAALGGVLGFLTGSIIGVVIGAINGSTMKVEFAPAPPRPLSPASDGKIGLPERRESPRLKFGEYCQLTEDCERGLTCQASRCLGTPLQRR